MNIPAVHGGAMQVGPKAKGTVLYVEDEEGDRLLMQMSFAKEGLTSALQMVNDGAQALQYISGTGAYADRQAHPLPSVVLLDLNLPEVLGFDVLKWIRAHPLHKALPVVVFTSSQRQEDRVRALELGANEFLLKPNSPGGFREVARKLDEVWLQMILLTAAGVASMVAVVGGRLVG